jgi:hypothetical protein
MLEIENAELVKQNEHIDKLNEEKLQLYENFSSLMDEKTEHEHLIREMMIRLKGEQEKVK